MIRCVMIGQFRQGKFSFLVEEIPMEILSGLGILATGGPPIKALHKN
jgi:hypothetical protein